MRTSNCDTFAKVFVPGATVVLEKDSPKMHGFPLSTAYPFPYSHLLITVNQEDVSPTGEALCKRSHRGIIYKWKVVW